MKSDTVKNDTVKNDTVKRILVVFALLLTVAAAQNKLYVRVEYNPSVQLLGYGGSGFYYDHILLLPDGTAFRFDDISEDSEQVLPRGISLATATASELANAGGSQGTYQEQNGTVQTSFGVSFPTSGGKYDSDFELSGYMLIEALPATFVTGQYENSFATVIGNTAGGAANATQVMAASSSSYSFYPDGSFDNAESSAVSSNSNDANGNFSVGTAGSDEDGSAGTYRFEGYNLFLTTSDGTQSVLAAYLWPPYSELKDQILMIDNSEYLSEDDSAVPFSRVPATASAPAPTSGTNPLSQAGVPNPLAQTESVNPLAQPQNQGQSSPGQNPLAPTENAMQNPLNAPTGQNPLAQPANTPSENPAPETTTSGTTTSETTASETTVSGTVTFPEGVPFTVAFVTICPLSTLSTQEDCSTVTLDKGGTYSVPLPQQQSDLMILAAMDADNNGQLNTGDYAAYQAFDPADGLRLDLVLTPYTE